VCEQALVVGMGAAPVSVVGDGEVVQSLRKGDTREKTKKKWNHPFFFGFRTFSIWRHSQIRGMACVERG